jgi:hypothetical protein
MSRKSPRVSVAFRAMLAAATLAGVAMVASSAGAQYAISPEIGRLAQAIETAATTAVTDARAQGLASSQTETAAAAAVEAVIAQSGDDTGTILAALSIAKRDLAMRNDVALMFAMNLVGRDMNGAFIAPSSPPGHGSPPIGSPPGGGGGGVEYRPPVH